MATQSYFGMPMPTTGTSPTALNQSQTAASTGASSSPLQSSLPTTSTDSTSARSLESQQTQDYGGGNPYLTGLNYSSQPTSPAPVQPQSSIPTGGTLQPVQSLAAATGGTSNIFGNATPQTLANIPGIRQMPNGQWSDGMGKLYNPTTGAVFYDPGGPGSTGAGLYQPGDTIRNMGQVPAYQPTPYVPRETSAPGTISPVMNQVPSYASPQIQTYPMGSMPTMGAVTNPNNPMPGDAPTFPVGSTPYTTAPGPTGDPLGAGNNPGGLIPSTGAPTTGGPEVGNAGGIPNSYNPLTSYPYTGNRSALPIDPATGQPRGIWFSGNQGPQQGSTAQVPQGFGQQPSLSPELTNAYFNWLYDRMGQGAEPYNQQQTFLPGQGNINDPNGLGQSAMQGLTAPENPLARYGRMGIQDFTRYIGGMIDPARLSSLRGEYGPLSDVGRSFAQTGGYGFPGSQLSLQAQYGARGNAQDTSGYYTGAQALQGSASGKGLPGFTGDYLNSAIEFGGMGLPANIQSAFAQYGAGPGAGGTTLSNMAQTGNPTDVGPAWDAMRQAQQRNIDQQAAQIRERMGLSGNLGLTGGGQATASTPYHTALTDFYSQTARDQNANLTQASQQAQEAARARMLGAAGTMSGQQLGAAQNLGALQQQAGLFGAGQQMGSSQFLQNLMSQGANQLGANQLAGAGLGANIVGQSQQTPYNIYGNLLGMQQGNLSNLANLGQQYQGLDQAAINRQYQEYLRTRPEYNPLLGQMFSGATTFPGVYSESFGSGALPSTIGQIAGGMLGGGLFGGGGGSGGTMSTNPVGGGGGGTAAAVGGGLAGLLPFLLGGLI